MITQSSTVVTINTSEQRRANSRVLLNSTSPEKQGQATKQLIKLHSDPSLIKPGGKSLERKKKKLVKTGGISAKAYQADIDRRRRDSRHGTYMGIF